MISSAAGVVQFSNVLRNATNRLIIHHTPRYNIA